MEKEAPKKEEEEVIIRHFSHTEHPLILKKLPQIYTRPTKQDHARHHDNDHVNDNDGDGDGGNNRGLLDHICKGCYERISLYYDDDPYCYRCEECEYDLHKMCAEAPLSIQHPLHQEHPLVLRTSFYFVVKKFVLKSLFKTKCCQRDWRKGFCYFCHTCEFKVDVICATAGERKVYNPHHENHLLYLFRQQHSARCNACGIRDEAFFFQCTTCLEFWLHKECAFLPGKIDYSPHHHPLTISYGLIHDHAQYNPPCRICKIAIDRNLWIYSCEQCRYFVHINCTMKPTPHLEDGNLSAPEEDGSPVVELPLGDEFHSLMERLLLNYDFANNSLVHDHPLILLHDHDHLQEDGKLRDDDKSINEPARSINLLHNPKKKIKLFCNACVSPIANIPFYRCRGDEQQQCCKDFFLHKHCAELPNELPHRLFHDQHPLMLLPKVPKFFGIFTCEICRMESNGFAYGCVGCEYYIDVRCAFIPVRIKHEAHPEHVLHLRKHYIKRCDGCWHWGLIWAFHCDKCNYKFKLCVGCAQLPKTMRHKYDEHPLELMYLPPEDHISGYFCDICEEAREINLSRWFYHCAHCDQQMHMGCSTSKMFGIKLGGFITVDPHPHRLTFAEWRTESNIKCKYCYNRISFGFRCVQCKYKYTLCWKCASKTGVIIEN